MYYFKRTMMAGDDDDYENIIKLLNSKYSNCHHAAKNQGFHRIDYDNAVTFSPDTHIPLTINTQGILTLVNTSCTRD